jgi:hypothetical protein
MTECCWHWLDLAAPFCARMDKGSAPEVGKLSIYTVFLTIVLKKCGKNTRNLNKGPKNRWFLGRIPACHG